MSIIGKALGIAARLIGLKPGPSVAPLGKPHVYTEPLSREEFWYGQDACIFCPRVDHQRVRWTDPPCPRKGRVENGDQL